MKRKRVRTCYEESRPFLRVTGEEAIVFTSVGIKFAAETPLRIRGAESVESRSGALKKKKAREGEILRAVCANVHKVQAKPTEGKARKD